MTRKMYKESIFTRRHLLLLAIYLVPIIALVAGIATHVCWAQDGDEEISFTDADVFLELNNTDGGLGIQGSIDGDAWKRMSIEDPKGRKIMKVYTGGKLRRHGLTQIDFESAEPSFDELDPGVFFKRFPEGEYDIEGRTIDGQEVESTAILTHVLPGPPDNIVVNGMELPNGCGDGAGPVVRGRLVITWDAVTESHPELGRTDEPIEVKYYQVVLEQLDLGLSFTADLPPETTEVIVPETFSDYGGVFKLEILVKEESGNKTATETCFTVE
jgi:hypothetical protein